MGADVLSFNNDKLPEFELKPRQLAKLLTMPAKPTPGNPVLNATVAVDLRFEGGRLCAAEGSKVMVEVSRYSETFWVYDSEMSDLIYTIDGRDKLFLYLDIDEEGLDVISSEGGISDSKTVTDA